jgi:hypothetical protein
LSCVFSCVSVPRFLPRLAFRANTCPEMRRSFPAS